MRRFAWPMAALGLMLAAPRVASQELPWLEAGQRVRVTAPEAGLSREVTSLVALSAESLVVLPRSGGPPLRLALASVRGLEVDRGSKHHTVTGMLLGALAGGAAGAISGYAEGDNSPEQNWLCDHLIPCGPKTAEGKAFYRGLSGAFYGAAVGGAIGLLVRTQRWLPVPLERMAVGVKSLPGGRTALGLALPL